MPVEKEPKLGLYIDAIKEWLPSVWVRFAEWVQACREEPALIWETTAVRIATYCAGAVVVVLLVSGLMHVFAPGGPPPVPMAETADFRVICVNPACGFEFVIQRDFDFDRFPVECAKCGQKAGQRAVRCNSEQCKGRWVAPVTADGQRKCPVCGAVLGPAD
jgi:hypothetical protein